MSSSEQQRPPRPLARGPGAWPTEWSVDVDDSRDTPAQPGSSPPAVVASTRLSPIQEAYGRWTTHTLECPQCQNIDSRACDESKELWRAWHEDTDDAYRKLNGESV